MINFDKLIYCKMRKLTIGIDATNIRQGGGVTHLTQMLAHAQISENPIIERVVIWSSKCVSEQLPDFFWLEKHCPNWTDSPLPIRIINQQFILPVLVKSSKCDVLFSPGGTLPIFSSVPFVAMSQNMLPFESKEVDYFGRWSLMWLKMKILRIMQSNSFKRSDGLIFLTNYAREIILGSVRGFKGVSAIVPHGIETRFQLAPRLQRPIESYSFDRPYRFLYVSPLMPYKHQIEVAVAVHQLRTSGLPVSIRFVGPDWGSEGSKLMASLNEFDHSGDYLEYSGPVSFEHLHTAYQEADGFVFASSCENLPNILIEAMSAGLPIACSNLGPMPEVLGDSGLYFDPTDSRSIASALERLVCDHELRAKLSTSGWSKSQLFSWRRCAEDTFSFISSVAWMSR